MTNHVTPWEVEGSIDYDALIKEFGTQRMDDKLLARLSKFGDLPVLLRRGFYFSHRDLNLILDDVEKKKPVFLYTGRGPSGSMHLGHLMPFELTKWLQDALDVNVYIQVTDDEKFVVKKDLELEAVQKQAETDMLEIAAMGFNPDKTFMFSDFEYAQHLYEPAMRIAKRVTYSTGKAVFGYQPETNLGWSFYPIIQNVPCFFEKARCLIPCAVDQDPYWRIQRDIAEKLGYYKTAAIHARFLSPLQGSQGKMSSSKPETAVYLSDDEKTVSTKINKYAFSGGQPTLEEQRAKGANLSIDVPYQWLYTFFEPDDKKIAQIAKDYSSGKMLTGEIKKYLSQKISAYLSDHQSKKSTKAKKWLQQMKYDGDLAKKMWKTIPMRK